MGFPFPLSTINLWMLDFDVPGRLLGEKHESGEMEQQMNGAG